MVLYMKMENVFYLLWKNASDFRTGPLIYSIVIGMSLGIVIMMILWVLVRKVTKFCLMMILDQMIFD